MVTRQRFVFWVWGITLCSPLTAQPPAEPWWPQAPLLPPPTGVVVQVETVDQLFRARARPSRA